MWLQIRKIALLIVTLNGISCNNGGSIKIAGNYQFAVMGDYYFPDLYYFDLSVTSGEGCDSVYWNDSIIIGKTLLYYDGGAFQGNEYFIIDMALYSDNPIQERSTGYVGPLDDESYNNFIITHKLDSPKFVGIKLVTDRIVERFHKRSDTK